MRKSVRRAAFCPSSPRSFFAIVRDNAERLRCPFSSSPRLRFSVPIPAGSARGRARHTRRVAADELVDEGAERQYLEPALAGVLERRAYQPSSTGTVKRTSSTRSPGTSEFSVSTAVLIKVDPAAGSRRGLTSSQHLRS